VFQIVLNMNICLQNRLYSAIPPANIQKYYVHWCAATKHSRDSQFEKRCITRIFFFLAYVQEYIKD